MDFVPSSDDRLHAILYDLVMGPTHARVVELDDDTVLLRTRYSPLSTAANRAATLLCATASAGYLTSRPSEDLACAAHQQVTREWWAGRKGFRSLRLEVRAGRGSERGR